LHGKSLIISRGALVKGAVSADQVVVDGTIEGPITGGDIILKSRAHVIGDIHHQSLSIENGASFEGRSVQTGRAKGNVTQPGEAAPQPSGKKLGKKTPQGDNGDTSAGGAAPPPSPL
jgi:cytoskeletal protein CcmA (bactofilin family)